MGSKVGSDLEALGNNNTTPCLSFEFLCELKRVYP